MLPCVAFLQGRKSDHTWEHVKKLGHVSTNCRYELSHGIQAFKSI